MAARIGLVFGMQTWVYFGEQCTLSVCNEFGNQASGRCSAEGNGSRFKVDCCVIAQHRVCNDMQLYSHNATCEKKISTTFLMILYGG